jgi:diadenosine tetraphosphate (Ap4A) HIT family hydrolase
MPRPIHRSDAEPLPTAPDRRVAARRPGAPDTWHDDGVADPVDRRVLDIASYEQQARSGRCFICQIVDGTHDFAHGEVWRDDTAIVFLNRYPTLRGYTLVAPLGHKRSLIDDLDIDEFLAMQRLVYRVGRAVSSVVPTERLYVLSLGSNQGNDHIHWHVAPLPPGTPYSDQHYHSLMVETSGYIAMSEQEHASLAAEMRAALVGVPR